jgi:hypothetical protein
MYELVYTSAAVRPFSPAELRGILERARPTNQKLGISGILLYKNGTFLQVLEGDEEPIRAQFVRIAKDPRHGRVRVVRQGAITRRSFGAWSMGFVSLDVKAVPLPGSHALSSNGSLDDDSDIASLLDRFRNGEWASVIT